MSLNVLRCWWLSAGLFENVLHTQYVRMIAKWLRLALSFCKCISAGYFSFNRIVSLSSKYLIRIIIDVDKRLASKTYFLFFDKFGNIFQKYNSKPCERSQFIYILLNTIETWSIKLFWKCSHWHIILLQLCTAKRWIIYEIASIAKTLKHTSI